MANLKISPGQIWKDDCYYFDPESGECQRKYLLVLAVEPASRDSVTMVFTSKPNGLSEHPPCSLGPPREGYFVGIPGGTLQKPTWVDFSSVQTLDIYDLKIQVADKRKILTQLILPQGRFCEVLRCALQSDDITLRQAEWIANTAAELRCQ